MIDMILLSFIIIVILVLLYRQLNKPARLLTLGRFVGAKNVGEFYIEEVAFDDYQGAIHGYFKLVPLLRQHGVILEERYDFFDFYSVVIAFDDCTLKLVRMIDKVRVIKSHQPMAIAKFEHAIATVVYQRF